VFSVRTFGKNCPFCKKVSEDATTARGRTKIATTIEKSEGNRNNNDVQFKTEDLKSDAKSTLVPEPSRQLHTEVPLRDQKIGRGTSTSERLRAVDRFTSLTEEQAQNHSRKKYTLHKIILVKSILQEMRIQRCTIWKIHQPLTQRLLC